MTYLDVLIRGQKVYSSCTTVSQLDTARRYTKLLVASWCQAHSDIGYLGDFFDLGDSMRCLRETKRKELLDV